MVKNTLTDRQTGESEELARMGNQTQEDAMREITTSEAPFTQGDNLGEQDAVGGSESAPETDDDVGDMYARVSGKKDKDGEDPQPLDIAKDINEAEEYQKTQ